MGYGPWGLKELDATEPLSIAQSIFYRCLLSSLLQG